MISEIQQIFKFELKMKSSFICSPEKVQKKKDCNLNSIIIDLENSKTFFLQIIIQKSLNNEFENLIIL